MNSLDIAKSIAVSVRDCLADASRSQKSLADETGIPYATLTRKLQGKSEFSLSELVVISEALGVAPYLLMPPVFKPGRQGVK